MGCMYSYVCLEIGFIVASFQRNTAEVLTEIFFARKVTFSMIWSQMKLYQMILNDHDIKFLRINQKVDQLWSLTKLSQRLSQEHLELRLWNAFNYTIKKILKTGKEFSHLLIMSWRRITWANFTKKSLKWIYWENNIYSDDTILHRWLLDHTSFTDRQWPLQRKMEQSTGNDSSISHPFRC